MKYTVKDTDWKGLNSIVQRYGYKDYKEAGVKSVPSGDFDLIHAGDVIEFNDKAPSSNVGIVNTERMGESFNKLKSEFDDSKQNGTLKEITNPLSDLKKARPDVAIDKNGRPQITGGANGEGKINDWESKKIEEEIQWFDKQLSDYDDLFKKMTSNLSTEKQSAIDRISNVFKQRLETQERINKFDMDRLKAYGLRGGSGKALYTPLMFSDVITKKEQENADKINDINIEMENSISEIERAFNEDDFKLAKEKLDKHYDLKEKLNKAIDEVEKQADYHLKKLRETEKVWKENLENEKKDALGRIAGYLSTQDTSNMSDEEKMSLAQRLAEKYGLDAYDVLGQIESSSYEKQKRDADIELKNEKVETEKARGKNIWNTIFNRNRNTKDQINKRKNNSTSLLGTGSFTLGNTGKTTTGAYKTKNGNTYTIINN